MLLIYIYTTVISISIAQPPVHLWITRIHVEMHCGVVPALTQKELFHHSSFEKGSRRIDAFVETLETQAPAEWQKLNSSPRDEVSPLVPFPPPQHCAMGGRVGRDLRKEISRAILISMKVITQQAVITTVISISIAQPPVHLWITRIHVEMHCGVVPALTQKELFHHSSFEKGSRRIDAFVETLETQAPAEWQKLNSSHTCSCQFFWSQP